MFDSLDERLFHVIYGYGAAGHGGLTFAMVALTTLGSGWSMVALLPFLWSRRTRAWASALTGSLLVTAALVFLLKLTFRRTRPFLALEGVNALFGAPTDFSFPSGHAAGSFAFAAFVATWALTRLSGGQAGEDREAQRRVPWGVLLGASVLALAFGVAVSRVYLGVHFPIDVFSGAVLGSVVGVLGAKAHLRGFRLARAQRLDPK
jgi:undecaprenyl-diphosphatase